MIWSRDGDGEMVYFDYSERGCPSVGVFMSVEFEESGLQVPIDTYYSFGIGLLGFDTHKVTTPKYRFYL